MITDQLLIDNGFIIDEPYIKKFNWRKLKFEKHKVLSISRLFIKNDIKICTESLGGFDYAAYYISPYNTHYRCEEYSLDDIYKFHLELKARKRKERLKNLDL